MARRLAEAGAAESERQAKKILRAALVQVAAALGNTPAVCRKSYIHPSVIGAWLEFRFRLEVADVGTGLRPEEAAVLAILQALERAPGSESQIAESRADWGEPDALSWRTCGTSDRYTRRKTSLS